MLKTYFFIVLMALLSSCIKDDILSDFVEPRVRITSSVDSLAIDSSFESRASYFNNVGERMSVDFLWTSSNINVAMVNQSSGLVKGVDKGSCFIYASHINEGIEKKDSFALAVSDTVIEGDFSGEKVGVVSTTSSYPLSGSYTLATQNKDLLLTFGNDYVADNSLPGLYVYLSNNKETVGSALEIGPVKVFSGTHSYLIPGVKINDYAYILYFCKPFNVKVGDGVIP